MSRRAFLLFCLLVIMTHVWGSPVAVNKLVVVQNFKGPAGTKTASVLNQKLRTLISRQSGYDFLTAEELKNLINSSFPDQEILECTSLDCLLKYKEQLPLLYFIEGEISLKNGQYSSLLIIYDLAREHFYRLKTPFTAEQTNNRLVINALYNLLSQPASKKKQADPKVKKEQELLELEQEVLQKKELARRLELELDNLEKTRNALQEKLLRFNELVRLEEKEEVKKD